MFVKIRFYYGAFIISFCSAILIIPALMISQKYKGAILHYINRLVLFLLGGKLLKEGTMDTTVDMYVMNHQGIIDIIGFEALQKKHVRWVAKKELFDTLWFGNLLRYGEMICINRGAKIGLRKLMNDVLASKEQFKRAVVIFPEGTRSNKQKLVPFKQGTNIIAKTLELRIQPIVITGTKWIFNEHNKTAHSGTVKYQFLPAIQVRKDDEIWYEKLQKEMQKVIDDELTYNNRSR